MKLLLNKRSTDDAFLYMAERVRNAENERRKAEMSAQRIETAALSILREIDPELTSKFYSILHELKVAYHD